MATIQMQYSTLPQGLQAVTEYKKALDLVQVAMHDVLGNLCGNLFLFRFISTMQWLIMVHEKPWLKEKIYHALPHLIRTFFPQNEFT